MQDRLILNRYRPISEAGSGGFGTVQVAWDTRIQRRVAIKCMKLDQAAIADNLSDAMDGLNRDMDDGRIPAYDAATVPGLEEARTAAMLSDPNIVGVLDFEVQGDTAYLIMEYVDGMTLTQLLDIYGDSLSLDVLGAIFDGVAHALEIAHENQVLHLDVKPDNVLINRQGQVKVTDFGLSKLSGVSGFSHAGGGTIGYMPLEQMRQEPLDARCDEWALAAMTYEMISGTNPFLARDIQHAQKAIEDAELVLPSLCMEGLDARADDVLFYALDPDRFERYDTIMDFAEEMQPCLGDPAAGRKRLAELVGDACEDLEEGTEPLSRVSRFDRVRPGRRNAFLRIWSLANCGVLGMVSLSNVAWLGGTSDLVLWGFFALLMIAAGFVPHLGALLAMFALGAAMVSHQAYIAAAVLVLASCAWWFSVGRRGMAQADTAISPALLGSIGCSQLSPLLCGFLLNTRQAASNALFSGMVAVFLAAMGSLSVMNWGPNVYWNHMALSYEQTILLVLQQPGTWAILVSWLVSAVVLALCCSRQARGLAFAGVVLAGAALIGGIVADAWLASPTGSFMPDVMTLVMTVIPIVVMAALALWGVPVREEDRAAALGDRKR